MVSEYIQVVPCFITSCPIMFKIRGATGKLPGSPGRKHSKRIMELTKRDTEIERVYIAEGYVGV